MRGAQHVQSFIWILNPPKLSEKVLGTYIKFTDNTIHTNLLDDPVLYELVNQYQTHEHSKSCEKYKNNLCRYGFSKFFTEKTIIAQPIEYGIEKSLILLTTMLILLRTHIGKIYLLLVFYWS